MDKKEQRYLKSNDKAAATKQRNENIVYAFIIIAIFCILIAFLAYAVGP